MNTQQIMALRCAVEDLVGAIRIAREFPVCDYDHHAAMLTVRELQAAFPEIDLDIPEDLK